MKVTRAIRMEFEPKDKPFDAYEAAMEAGSPSLAHVAMEACEAARETGLRKGFVEVSEKGASVRLPNPVPRRHRFSRELPLPFDDARCAEFCADMLAWARSMRAEAAEKEAGGSVPPSLLPKGATPTMSASEKINGRQDGIGDEMRGEPAMERWEVPTC